MQLSEQRLHTHWQQKVFTKLLGLQYHIIYKRSVDNSAADALSRYLAPSQLMAVSAIAPVWLADVQGSYPSDPEAQTLLAVMNLSSFGV